MLLPAHQIPGIGRAAPTTGPRGAAPGDSEGACPCSGRSRDRAAAPPGRSSVPGKGPIRPVGCSLRNTAPADRNAVPRTAAPLR